MRRALITAALSCFCLGAAAQGAPEAEPLPSRIVQTTNTLIEQGLADDIGLQFVEDLTTEVGARLAGSQAERRARDWSVAELRSLGFRNVRIEEFDIPFWSRVTESAHVVSPGQQELVITALGGSADTGEGSIEADIIRFESMDELRAGFESDIRGKIVFVDEVTIKTQDGSGYGLGVRKRRECAPVAAEKGGVGCLIRSVGTQPRRFPHTGMTTRPDGAAEGSLPAAALSPPDADQLTRLLERGAVTVRLNIQTETLTGVPSGNVIGEVPGERPDEIVLISCHLDSWDLGTGALDDAAGCGIVIGAAKLIDSLPGQPKRTIRVVLYGAEEVGLLGGAAYAREHSEDLENHILASESDFGAGPVWRFQTRFGEGALGYAAALQKVLAPLGVTAGDNNAFGGPDIRVLARSGVPVVTPGQDGRDYFDYHHTPDDTFDKIKPEEFRQNVAVYAAFAYIAAESGWDFRAPAEPEEAE